MRPILSAILTLVLVLGGCGDEEAAPAEIVALEMTPGASLTAVGEPRRFEVVGLDADGQRRAVEGVEWISSEPGVVGVEGGVATGVAPGEAMVMARAGELAVAATVAVTSVRLTALGLTPETPTVFVGESVHLTVTATFEDDSSQYVTPFVVWTQSVPGVALVTRGEVVGVAPGEVVLTARVGEVSGSILVRVLRP